MEIASRGLRALRLGFRPGEGLFCRPWVLRRLAVELFACKQLIASAASGTPEDRSGGGDGHGVNTLQLRAVRSKLAALLQEWQRDSSHQVWSSNTRPLCGCHSRRQHRDLDSERLVVFLF